MRSLLLALLVLTAQRALAQLPPHILVGAAYYAEYMPRPRLEQDIRLMQGCGINCVRLGESTWSRWEPADGDFRFGWADTLIERFGQAGIYVILGTPTYSVPPWLAAKHPEILLSPYGQRQNMDITHPVYLRYAYRITEKLAQRYGKNPHIIGIQVDNETKSYGTQSDYAHALFVDYLKARFATPEALNRAWGLAYWGQQIHTWADLPRRKGAVQPSYRLAWDEFQRELAGRHIGALATIVRKHLAREKFVTHNFDLDWRDLGYGPQLQLDHFEAAKAVDVTGIDIYHHMQDRLDGAVASLGGDYARSFKRSNYLVLESPAQGMGWDSKYSEPPYPGQLRQLFYSHLASGADMVSYWPWHSIHNGIEMFWKGILSHDLEPGRAYAELRRTTAELRPVEAKLRSLKKRSRVAVLYSGMAASALQIMPFSTKHDYNTLLRQLYDGLYKMNVPMDFITPTTTARLKDYDLVVVPPLSAAPDSLLEALSKYVEGGGHILMLFKAGFADEHYQVRQSRLPGPLRQACGFSYQEFSNFGELPLKGNPLNLKDTAQNRAQAWQELLVPDKAEPLAFVRHPFFGQYPAITRNRFGRGVLTYQATALTDQAQQALLADVVKTANLTGPEQRYAFPLIVKAGTNAAGRTVRYLFNYSGTEQKTSYAFGAGRELLTGKAIKQNEPLTLEPWGVLVVEE